MNASQIDEILKNLHKMPYRCVLISGDWGVGKSYTVNKALPECSCVVSLFGIRSTEY